MSDERDVVLSEELSGELELTGQALDVGRVVRPGDVLVLSCDRNVTVSTVDELRRQMLERFPELADVAVLGGMRFEFVYRKDDEP